MGLSVLILVVRCNKKCLFPELTAERKLLKLKLFEGEGRIMNFENIKRSFYKQ